MWKKAKFRELSHTLISYVAEIQKKPVIHIPTDTWGQ